MKNLLTWLFCTAIFTTLSAQNSYDPSFGNNGVVTTNFGGIAQGGKVMRQSNGKLLLGGPVLDTMDLSFLRILRYHPDGSLDSSFANAGILSSGPYYGGAFTLQEDDKILAANGVPSGIDISRFLPDGSPDSTFGNAGNVIAFSNDPELWEIRVYAIAVLPNEKFLVGGCAKPDYSSGMFFIARFNPSGSVDSTFGVNGKVMPDGSEELFRVNSLVIQPDGKILAETSVSFPWVGAIVRLNQDGSFDEDFGWDGIIGGGDAYYGETILLQPDGKIILLNLYNKRLTRFNEDGSGDLSFGNLGQVVFDVEIAGWDDPKATAALIDDKILVAVTANNQDYDFGILRYYSNGAIDSSFGIFGRMDVDIWAYDRPQSILPLPDGKIAVAGTSDGKFSLATLFPDGDLDTGFGNVGKIMVAFGAFQAKLVGIAQLSGGQLVAVGSADIGDIVLARYLENGSLDLSFGMGGKVITDLKIQILYPGEMSLLPDDNILVAGTLKEQGLFLFRYLPDGTPDPVFGENGLVVIETAFEGIGVELQPDGKYLVRMNLSDNSAIGRLLPDGTPDEQFGDDGWIYLQGISVYELQIQPDGKIIAGGHSFSGFNIFRFLPDGSPDLSFNFLGKAITGLDRIHAMRVLDDGKIIVAGERSYLPEMVQLLPSGAIDPEFQFSENPFFSAFEEIVDIALLPNGKILFTGSSDFYNGIFIGRAFSDGTLDASFFVSGLTRYDPGEGEIYSSANKILIQPDGKTVIGGVQTNSDPYSSFSDSDFLLLRIPADPHVGVNEQNPGIAALSLSPNPLQSQATLSYELPRAETVSILLHDASGKPVWTFVSEEKRRAGTNREEIAIPKELPEGVYYLTVKVRGGQSTIKIAK